MTPTDASAPMPPRRLALWLGVAGALIASAALAQPASALFGDNYGAAPINDHPEAIQDAPAIPSQDAFWAGACTRAHDPGIGEDLAAAGDGTGFGVRPDSVIAAAPPGPPNLAFGTQPQVAVPAPASVDHCLDVGTTTDYEHRGAQDGRLWQAFPFDTGEPASFGGTIGQELEPDCVFPDAYTAPVPPYPAEWEPFPEVCDGAPKWRLPAEARAGAHPDGTAMLAWNRNREGGSKHGAVDGSVDNVIVDLPPGFVGNPQAVPMCTQVEFRAQPLRCSPASQVGILRLNLEGIPIGAPANMPGTHDTTYAVYNLEPRQGNVAELGFAYAGGAAAIRLVAKARTNEDFGVTTFVGQIPAALVAISQQITLWGVPWAAENDIWRSAFPAIQDAPGECKRTPGSGLTAGSPEYIPPTGAPDGCWIGYQPSWGPIEPFLASETGCNPAPTVTLRTDSYHDQGAFTAEGDPDPSDPNWKTYESTSPPVTDCESLDFSPEITLQPTSAKADSPTGLDVELTIPQKNDALDSDGAPLEPPAPGASEAEIDAYVAEAGEYFRSDAGRATAHLRDTVVTLPEGMAVSPSAAWGLEACSTDQIGLRGTNFPEPSPIRFNNQPVKCPDGSTIGNLSIDTPLLEDPLPGTVYLAAQNDNPFDSLLAIYLVAEDEDLGLRVKLAGHTEPDPDTGQLKTTFLNNPQLPFETFTLSFKGGPRGVLVNPPSCGTHVSTSRFTSWAQPGSPVTVNDAFSITQSANGGSCPPSAAARAFSPSFSAGLMDLTAAQSSPFVLRFTRDDGDQELLSIDTVLPEGLAAKLRGVGQCPEAAANAGTCGPASKVGEVRAGAGPGPTPFFVPTGDVHLTGPYKGAPLGLSIKVPAQAGPFDLGDVVVRAAVHVNPITAQVTAVSDDMPLILEGIPTRVRDVRVNVNRSEFMVAPTSCEEDAVRATIHGTHSSSAERQSRFQIAGCSELDFSPQFRFRATGRGHHRPNRHPQLEATVSAPAGQANIARARVTLPRGMFLDQDNLETICTRPQFAADECPDNTVIGHAKATSPLLDDPLEGLVHLIASDNPLPDIVSDLRGIVDINVFSRTSSNRRTNRITNTFDVVPDAAVSSFELTVTGGPTGLLVNSRNICRKPAFRRIHIEVEGHNGKSANQTRMVQSRPCARQRANQLTRRAKKLRQRAKRAARNGNKARAKKLRQRAKRLSRRASNIRQGLNQRRTP